jgi:hypothetical protein
MPNSAKIFHLGYDGKRHLTTSGEQVQIFCLRPLRDNLNRGDINEYTVGARTSDASKLKDESGLWIDTKSDATTSERQYVRLYVVLQPWQPVETLTSTVGDTAERVPSTATTDNKRVIAVGSWAAPTNVKSMWERSFSAGYLCAHDGIFSAWVGMSHTDKAVHNTCCHRCINGCRPDCTSPAS